MFTSELRTLEKETIMETYEQTLKRNLAMCKRVCDDVNIPYRDIVNIKVNTRAKTRWGLCKSLGGDKFEIEISDRLLQPGVSSLALMNTLLHEILHTCYGCMNHGKQWKAYAQRLNNIGYNIKRCTSSAEKNIPEVQLKREYKYKVICNKCGYEYKYMRKGEVIKQIERNPNRHGCRCGRCNSRNLKLITL